MPVNHYLNPFTNRSEQKLVENLVCEAIRNYGMMVHYVPRTFVKLDRLFGEDTQSAFTKTYPVEMYLDSVSGFEGDRSFLSKFGLEIRKQASFIVARRRFNETVKFTGAHSVPIQNAIEKEVRPMEGDIIYVPLTNDIWEIRFAEHESVFYQLGKNYIWRITVEKFIMSNETFKTGVDAIDKIGSKFKNDGSDNFLNDPIANNPDIDQEWVDKVTVKGDPDYQDFSETNPFGPEL